MTTTTTSCTAGGAVSPLVTAVADALDDLGLKRLVVGNRQNNTEEEEQQAE